MMRIPEKNGQRRAGRRAALLSLAVIAAGCLGEISGEGEGVLDGGNGGDIPRNTTVTTIWKHTFSQFGVIYALTAMGTTLYVSSDTGLYLVNLGNTPTIKHSEYTSIGSVKAPVKAPATIDGQMNVYFTRANNYCLAALNANCKHRWTIGQSNYFNCQAVSDTQPGLLTSLGQVVVATYSDGSNAYVIGVNMQSGKEDWKEKLAGSNVRRSLLVSKAGKVLVGTEYSSTGILYEVTPAASSSSSRTLFDKAFAFNAPPMEASNGDIFIGDKNYNLFSLYEAMNDAGAKQWQARWQVRTGGPIYSSPVESKGQVLVAAALMGVFSVGLNGLNSWKVENLNIYNSGLSLNSSGVVFTGTASACSGSGSKGCVYAIKDKKILWKYPIGNPVYATPLVYQGNLIVGDEGGTLYSLKIP